VETTLPAVASRLTNIGFARPDALMATAWTTDPVTATGAQNSAPGTVAVHFLASVAASNATSVFPALSDFEIVTAADKPLPSANGEN
jgi:hypothetical protein